MSNGTYLAVSYVGLGVLALLMMVFVYLVLRDSYAQIADAMTPNARGQFLKRAFPVVLTLITGTGFFSVSYNYKGCTIFTYEQVMKDRGYLVKTNREQLKETSASLATGVLLWELWRRFVWSQPASRTASRECPRPPSACP
jgi:hypothetical protein